MIYLVNHNTPGLCRLHHVASSGLLCGALFPCLSAGAERLACPRWYDQFSRVLWLLGGLLPLCYSKSGLPPYCCLSTVVLKKCIEALSQFLRRYIDTIRLAGSGGSRYQAPPVTQDCYHIWLLGLLHRLAWAPRPHPIGWVLSCNISILPHHVASDVPPSQNMYKIAWPTFIKTLQVCWLVCLVPPRRFLASPKSVDANSYLLEDSVLCPRLPVSWSKEGILLIFYPLQWVTRDPKKFKWSKVICSKELSFWIFCNLTQPYFLWFSSIFYPLDLSTFLIGSHHVLLVTIALPSQCPGCPPSPAVHSNPA